MLLGLLLSAVALAGWALLPGLAVALFTLGGEEEPRPLHLGALTLLYGLAIWVLGSEVLAMAGVLRPIPVWVGAGMGGVAGWVGLWLQRDRLHLLRPGGELLILSAGSLVAIAPQIVLVARRPHSLIGPTPWYYWWLSRSVAQIGGFPDRIGEWGATVAFPLDYPGFNAATAWLLQLGDLGAPLLAAHVIRVAGLAATAFGFAYLARVLGAGRWAAAAAPIALLATSVVFIKSASYRSEPFGYGLMFLLIALSARMAEHRDRRHLLWPVAVGVATLSQIHGLVLLTGVMLSGAAFVAVGLIKPGEERIRLRDVARLAGIVVGTWLVANLLPNSTAGHLLRLERPGGLSTAGDPTWQFFQLVSGVPGGPPSAWELLSTGARQGFGRVPEAAYGLIVLVAVAGAIWAAVRTREGRTLLIFVTGAAVAILATAALFALGWSTYVPRRTGLLRMVQLGILMVPLTLAVVASVLGSPLRRVLSTGWVVLAMVLWMLAIPPLYRRLLPAQPSPHTLTALREIDLPDGSLVLANAYTEGFIPLVLEADGLLDGRAPYTQPALLRRANGLLREGREFFEQPDRGFPIEKHGVTHVMVALEPWVLGTSNVFPTDPEAVGGLGWLQLVEEGPGFRLYEVKR